MKERILVVYYSRSGRTRKVAANIAWTLDCDIEEIAEPGGRLGLFGSLRSAEEAWRERPAAIEPPRRDPSSYDLIIIGTPVWAWSTSSPVRAYLTAMKARLPDVAFFCTLGASGRARVFDQMQRLAGKAPRAVCATTQRDVGSGAYRDRVAAFVRALASAPVGGAPTPSPTAVAA